LYQTVPNRFIDWREAAIGGLVAAIGFEITRRLFAFSIAIGGGYRAIYGALAAVPIFLIWIYLFWLITLLGAVVAAALPVMRYERWWHRAAPGAEFLDAVAVLKVLYDAREGHAAVDAVRLRELTHLGFEESESLLQRMLDADWVGRIRPQRAAGFTLRRRAQARLDRWTLLVNPERLTLAEVYQRFAFTPTNGTPLSHQVARMIERDLSTSLADYFAAPSAKPNSASST
jgi:membrane protein